MYRVFLSVLLILFCCCCCGNAQAAAAELRNDQNDPAWSRSLPSSTVKGFPLFAQHAVLAQDANSGILYAFAVNDGTPLWNATFHDCPGGPLPSYQFLPLLPSVLDTGFQDAHHRHLLVVQSVGAVIALDLFSGACAWVNTEVFRAPAAVYLPVMSSDGRFVIVAAPKLVNPPPSARISKPPTHTDVDEDGTALHVTGLDVNQGQPLWQHQEDQLCNDFPTGSALPVMVTQRTFFGCFVNPNFAAMRQAQKKQQQQTSRGRSSAMSTLLFAQRGVRGGPPAPTIVKEIELNDNAFHCRVFDFSPRSILMTPSFQFFSRQDGAPGSNGQGEGHPGEADRVAFFISTIDTSSTPYKFVGPSSLVSIIAQAGMVEWQRFLPGSTVTLATIAPHDATEKVIVVSDGLTYVTGIHTVNGNPMWNHTVAHQLSQGSGAVAQPPPPPQQQVSLGAIDMLSVSKSHFVVAQDCAPSQQQHEQETTPVKVLTVYGLDGTLVSQTPLYTWSTSPVHFVAFNSFVYFATEMDVSTLNVATGAVARLMPTGMPVDALALDMVDGRALFGTPFSIFCVQTK